MAKSGITLDFDSKKFEKSLKKELQKMVDKTPIDVTCPNCNHDFKISKGLNHCPNCQMTLDFDTTVQL